MNPCQYAAAAAIILVTHALGAIAAYGSTLLAVPLLVLSGIDLHTAVLVPAIAGFAQSWYMYALLYRQVDRHRLWVMLLPAGIGLPLGRLAAGWLPETALLATLGGILITAGLSQMLRLRPVEQFFSLPPVLTGLLFAGGIIHGAFACGGAAIVIYARWVFPEKESFRATLTAFWAILNSILVPTLIVHAHIHSATGLLVAIALPLVIMGTLIGQRIAVHLKGAHFRILVDLLLIGAGITTMIRVCT